jgi:hypothetical protein
MALNFPNSPTVNDEVVLGGKTYKWDGVKWLMIKVISPPPPTASTAAPTITIVTEAPDGVTFTLTNNDDNTAFITYEIDDEIAVIELAAAATSSNITVALAVGTYTLTAYATVVGEVASQSSAAVEIVSIQFELLYDSTGTVTLPQTQIDITGLSIGKNDELRLVYTFVGDNSSINTDISLNANDITSNYNHQRLEGIGSSIFATRTTVPLLAFASSVQKTAGFADIKVSNNDRFVAQSQFAHRMGADSSNITNRNTNIVNTGTVTSITKLSIVGNRTNGIAAGSRIRLYKVNTGDA